MGLIVPKGHVIDHWDLNGLNNKEENLRIITYSESNYNNGLQDNNTSGRIGIGINIGVKSDKPYYMQYSKNKERKFKYYSTYEEAIVARIEWEIKTWGYNLD